MPDDAGRDAAFYDHEREPRRHVADWGGDDLFTRMPRRRAVHTGPSPRFRRAAPVDPAHRAAPDAPGRFARADREDPLVDWTGPLVAPDHDEEARRVGPARADRIDDAPHHTSDAPDLGSDARHRADYAADLGSDARHRADDAGSRGDDARSRGDEAPYRSGEAPYRTGDAPYRTGDAPYRTGRFGDGPRGPHARPAARRDPGGAPRVGTDSQDRGVTMDLDATRHAFAPAHEASVDSTRRVATELDSAPSAGDLDLDLAASARPAPGGARRTVVIEGRPDGVPRLLPERRRPPRTVAERVGPRPERIVAWAFALGLLLILIAIATADAATI